MQSFIIKIENNDDSLIREDNICCYLLDSSFKKDFILKQAEQIRTQDKMVLLTGAEAPRLCKELNLDGVLIEVSSDEAYKKQILPAREIIGRKKVLGVVCPVERHAAMIVSECEPEFVAFRVKEEDRARELISWYNELFLIQSAVINENCGCDLLQFDTDFVVLTAKEYKNLLLKEKV